MHYRPRYRPPGPLQAPESRPAVFPILPKPATGCVLLAAEGVPGVCM